MTPQVTATGIKDGDPAVLRALVDRRGTAVLAYCERACAPSLVLEAVSDAFARFRAAVIAAERPGDLHPEVALLSATRLAAAARSPRPPAPPVSDPTASLGRLLASTASVEIVPELLLRRADGRLSDAEDAVLEDLLDASPVARALEERFSAAEDAYRTAPREALPAPLAEQIVRTMAETDGPIPVSRTPVFEDPTVEIDALTPPQPAAPEPAAPASTPAASAPRFARAVDGEEGSGFFPRRLRRKKKAEAEAEPPGDGPTFTPLDVPAAEAEPGLDAGPTMEWQVPDESADEQLAAEAGVARATEDPEDAVEHVQSASGVVEETVELDALPDDVAEEEPVDLADPVDDEPEQPAAAEAPEPAAEETEPAAPDDAPEAAEEVAVAAEEVPVAEEADETDEEDEPAEAEQPSPPPPPVAAPAPKPPARSLPGRAALLPALAVVAIAAVGAMVAAGIFGGNDPSPPLDTGIVPERAQQAVPEGEAASVVDDLRAASAEARRKRLADQRAAGIIPGDEQPDLGTSTPDITGGGGDEDGGDDGGTGTTGG